MSRKVGVLTSVFAGICVAFFQPACDADQSTPTDVATPDVVSVDDSGSGAGDTTGVDDSKDAGNTPANELAKQLYEAVAACGYLSTLTVPGGWQPIMITSSGCSQWIPADWLILGQADQMVVAADQSQQVASFALTGMLNGTDWTIDAINDYALENIGTAFKTQTPGVLYYKSYDILGTAASDCIYVFDNLSTPEIGYLRVIFSGCNYVLGTCSAVLMGFWIPKAEMSKWACTVAQIDASVKCPGGGIGREETDR
jgi:hypothetical protein